MVYCTVILFLLFVVCKEHPNDISVVLINIFKLLFNAVGTWLCLASNCVSGRKLQVPRILKSNSLITVLMFEKYN